MGSKKISKFTLQDKSLCNYDLTPPTPPTNISITPPPPPPQPPPPPPQTAQANHPTTQS